MSIKTYRHSETFQDQVARLFKEENSGKVRSVTFQVTDACNLRCTYCYQINKGHHSMSFETAKAFIDKLLADELKPYISTENSAGITIEFIGGEPLLEIDLIEQITDYFISEMIRLQHPWLMRYRICVCSNGLLYFDERWQRYMKRHMRNLSFSISIDGNKDLHDSCRLLPDGSGSYDIAMAGVRHYIDTMGGQMGSKMTLAPGNIAHTFEAVKALIETGYEEINLNCVYEQGWELCHAKIMYEQLKKLADYMIDAGLFNKIYVSIFEQIFFRPKPETDLQNWCGGASDAHMIAVDWKGDIYPCIRYMESSLGTEQPPIIIGNVKDGIMVTEKQRDCVHCLEAVNRRTQSTDQCFYCPIAEGCSWCSAYNYQCFGTANKRATYICIMHQSRALANAYYWNKGFRLAGMNKRMRINIPEDWALNIISPDEWAMLKSLEGAD